MATKQFPINASTVDVQVSAADPDRRFVYVKNYVGSTVNIYVAFGQVATAGTNGELEVIPGAEYVFGGPLPPSRQIIPGGFILPTCPLETIHVITPSSTATGCVITQ